MINLKTFEHNDWVKIWDGGWSFLSCSHFGEEYTKEIIFGKKTFHSQSIIFTKKGRSSGWMRQIDRDVLGNFLAKEVKDVKSAKIIASRLKNQAEEFLEFIKKFEDTTASEKLYWEFWQRLCLYYKEHINVKYIVDYLEPKLLAKYLPIFQEARLAAEPVLNRTEDFMVSFAKILSKKSNYTYKLLLCVTKPEIQKYFKSGSLPKKTELQKRYNSAVLIHNKTSFTFFAGKNVKKVESLVKKINTNFELKGQSAFKGKISGYARLVLDPKKAKNFKQGDILITGATRPEFLPIMHIAAAFVTDAGGILSHAAITARELKKPCVIGTQHATKVFKDGDIIEVDADKGIIRKLK